MKTGRPGSAALGLLTAAGLWALLIAGLSSCAQPEPVRLFQVGSLRGQLFPLDGPAGREGGLSLVAARLEDLRQTQGPVVALAAFNTYFGTPEAYFTQGQAVIELLNSLNFSGLFVGVRDLYFGREGLETLAALARFPFLSANLRLADGQVWTALKPYLKPAGADWALIVLSPRSLLSQNRAHHIEGLTLIPEEQAVAEAVQAARAEGARRFWLFSNRQDGGEPGSPEEEALLDLLDLPDIELVFTGTVPGQTQELVHPRTNRRGELRWIVREHGPAYVQGRQVSLLTVPPVLGPEQGPRHQPFEVRENLLPPEGDLAGRLAALRENLAQVLDSPLTQNREALNPDFDRESPLGNFLADLFREHYGAEVALLQSGAIRSPLPAGMVTRLDAYKTMPFGGQMLLAKISGRRLLGALERSHTFPGRPERGRGYLQVSGLEYEVSVRAPEGRRVLPGSVRVGGRPLDPQRDYTVVLESYLYGGGDGHQEIGQPPLPVLYADTDPLHKVLETRLAAQDLLVPPASPRVVLRP